MTVLDDAETVYLAGQRLGRLATLGPGGAPQVRPVGFRYDPELGVIDIGGMNMAASRKYRNVLADGRVSFVVDDLATTEPWRPPRARAARTRRGPALHRAPRRDPAHPPAPGAELGPRERPVRATPHP